MGSLRQLATGLSIAGGLTFVSSPAHSAAMVMGSTSVTLTAAPTLKDAGIKVAPTGSATATVNDNIPTVTFPITGTATDPVNGALLIDHSGSGLLFSMGNNSLATSNFVINTGSMIISGDVSETIGGVTTSAGSVSLFNLVGGNTLTLTSAASSAFNTVFGANLPAGTAVGTASVNLTGAVPEPGTWMMMLLGFCAVGVAVRRRRGGPAIA